MCHWRIYSPLCNRRKSQTCSSAPRHCPRSTYFPVSKWCFVRLRANRMSMSKLHDNLLFRSLRASTLRASHTNQTAKGRTTCALHCDTIEMKKRGRFNSSIVEQRIRVARNHWLNYNWLLCYYSYPFFCLFRAVVTLWRSYTSIQRPYSAEVRPPTKPFSHSQFINSKFNYWLVDSSVSTRTSLSISLFVFRFPNVHQEID